MSFLDSSAWSAIILFAVLLGSLLIANVLKRSIGFLRDSLIPSSVLAGVLLLIVSGIFRAITKDSLFELSVFGEHPIDTLEVITYHSLALGFIASTFRTTGSKLTKKRATEIFNTGVTTVNTYLVQGVVGLVITMIAALIVPGFFAAAGVILPFGFGQGTGQALNYGSLFENDYGFVGGESFGLSIAALGFLVASIGGVIHLNILKRKGKLVKSARTDGSTHTDEIESDGEIPMQESVDKLTIQIALIVVAYLITYIIMYLLGLLLPGMKSVIYGFNFLIGVLAAMLMKLSMNFLRKKGIMKKKYTNNFLLTRASNFFYDIMVVAGIAAIRLEILENYWGILLILGFFGTVVTYVYNRFVAKKLFPDYYEEQFLAMYGMLTGTASTGVILLREVDGDFRTPASDNIVYQNFPAIVFGLPIMLLASETPNNTLLCTIIFALAFLVMNVVLFRSYIFKKRLKTKSAPVSEDSGECSDKETVAAEVGANGAADEGAEN